MGTIASVLQWTCSNSDCRYINPTESLKCINCGNIRRIKIPAYLASPDEYDDGCENDSTSSPTEHAINSTATAHRTKTTNSDFCDETLPGYVEINSNGYIYIFIFCYCSRPKTDTNPTKWKNLQIRVRVLKRRRVSEHETNCGCH